MIEQSFLQMLQRHTDAPGSSDDAFSSYLKDYLPQEPMTANLMAVLYEMGIHTAIENTPEATNAFACRLR